jgi:hypothetical protein
MPRGAFRPCGVGRSVADDDSLDPSCGVFGKISVPSAAACLLRAVRYSERCCGLHAATMGRRVFGKISSVATPVMLHVVRRML